MHVLVSIPLVCYISFFLRMQKVCSVEKPGDQQPSLSPFVLLGEINVSTDWADSFAS